MIIAKITLRALFDRKFKENAQTIIDGKRNEKTFWFLMGQDINPQRIFNVYLRTMNQNDQIRNADCIMNIFSKHETDPYDLDKNIIPKLKGDPIKIVNSFLPLIQKREEIITDYLNKNTVQFLVDTNEEPLPPLLLP